ncbi:MAG: hypothetical protein ACYTFQ_32660 [Planctomycetota bacterium]|jgi:hypothetical protein
MPEETTFEEMVAAEGAAAEDTPAADPPADPPAEPDTPTGDEPTGDEPTGDEPPAEPDGKADDEPEIDDETFLDALGATGYDFRGKYGTRQEAIAGLKNAFTLLGQRSEDAQIAKTLRDRLGDEAFERLVAGTPAPTKEPPPNRKGPVPRFGSGPPGC